LRLLLASADDTNVTVTWQSAEGVSYILQRNTNILRKSANSVAEIVQMFGQFSAEKNAR
jgi:hypothetical protein